MPLPSSTLTVKYQRKLVRIENVRREIEVAARGRHLSNEAVLEVYGGLFLEVFVGFESFLDDLFVGLMLTSQMGVKSSRTDVVPRIVVRSHKIAREILIQNRKKFVDWVPYDNTVELAEKYFRGGRPFTDLPDEDRDQIRKCHVIRNVIAHKSRFSKTLFQKLLLSGSLIPPHEREPSSFLRGEFQVNKTRFENFSAQLMRIARKLAL